MGGDEVNTALVLNVDGGSRGNPGPAAIGVVISTPAGELLEELARPIGRATNNVAEYEALLLALRRAAARGARQVRVINDSQLISRQLTGAYKVKHPSMRPLHAQALELLTQFSDWSIESVPRARNAAADALVNEALDSGAAIQRTHASSTLLHRE